MSDEKTIDFPWLPWLERLHIEADELEEKVDKLGRFIGSAEYKALDMDHRSLLDSQRIAMCSYLSCLRNRILLLTPKEGDQDGVSEEPAEEGC